jgi:SRSO17 transposase
LNRLKEILQYDVHVTILADRGFGNVEFYEELERLKFDYVIRFKSNVYVTDSKGEERTAQEWVGQKGRAKRLENAEVTKGVGKIVPVLFVYKKKI